MTAIDRIRGFVLQLLAERGDARPLSDGDSLFLSGRLDSLAATQVMLELESAFGLDLADLDFDVTRLDTVADIAELAGQGALAA